MLISEVGLNPFLREFEIDQSRHSTLIEELRIVGISHAALFPDLDGLAADLAQQFWIEDKQ